MGKQSTKSRKATKKAAAPVVETEETTEESGTDPLAKVLNPTSVRPNIQAFVDWVEENGGPRLNAKHAQVAITAYKRYQKSDAAVTAREAAAAEKAEAKAARERAREERRAAQAEKAAEREERKAAREKAAAERKAKKTTSAAKASAPKKGKKAEAASPKARAGKKTAATKKTAAKKTAAKKAAF